MQFEACSKRVLPQMLFAIGGALAWIKPYLLLQRMLML